MDIIIIISALLLAAAVVLAFFSGWQSATVAFLGLCVTGLVDGVYIQLSTYMFWGLSWIVILALHFMLPPAIAKARLGLPYISGGALVGMIVGIAVSGPASIIIGAVAGALLGGVAFGKTPGGKVLEFPTSKFFNYLCAKGLPAAITMCIVGTAVQFLENSIQWHY